MDSPYPEQAHRISLKVAFSGTAQKKDSTGPSNSQYCLTYEPNVPANQQENKLFKTKQNL